MTSYNPLEHSRGHDILAKSYRTGSVTGVVTGAVLSLSGVVLLILGLSGSIDWIVQVAGLSSRLVNASPGVIVTIAGLAVMVKFKPKVRYTYEVTARPDYYREKGSGSASSPIGR